MNEQIEDGPSREITDSIIETLARCLLPKIQEYYESPEGRAEYERWKAEHRDSDK